MDEILNEQEIRVLGCLIEKDRTTPDYYPLTVNALVNACNQKSNRNPVLSYNHDLVLETVETLRWRGWVIEVDEAGSRVVKYRHAFTEKTGHTIGETAVLAELMLRGPQTGGEIHSRAKRMHPFAGLAEVQEILGGLAAGETPRVVRLPRQPGRKERRYQHLLSGVVDPGEEGGVTPNVTETPPVSMSDDRVEKLEEEVRLLHERLATLEDSFREFRKQF